MESSDQTKNNIEKIGLMFPSVITEIKDKDGNLEKVINFDKLKELLTDAASEGIETYEFSWPGKKEALAEAYRPIRKTLRPQIEKSLNWNETENLYIEGDNLDVLKLLQESYLNRIKMIYIDPPYNTGHDFIYKDDYSQSEKGFNKNSGFLSEEEDRLVKNTDSNGRFHSDWCSMIYSRLVLSRNLLTKDGVIFISVDDNEQSNLKKICDEVFGERNFVAQLIWERAYSPKNDAKFVSNSHDYILMYAFDIDSFKIGRLPRTEEANARYQNPDNDPRGPWKSGDMSVKTYSKDCDYPITLPSGRIVEPPAGRCWRLSKSKFIERLNDNRIWFGTDGNSVPSIKRFLSELKFDGMAPTSLLFYKDVGHSQEGAKETSALLGGGYFDGPKPVRLIKRLMTLANLEPDSIVMDFFSGSATTAQAVIEMNEEKETHYRFIMVQLPEQLDPKGKGYEAGYRNICQIGTDRIKKVIQKAEDKNHLLHSEKNGFRYLSVSDSNMKDVYFDPFSYQQNLLSLAESNIKEDRTDEDLLYGCLIDWGLELTSSYQIKELDSSKIITYDKGTLIACFSENIPESVVNEIAKRKPLRAVFRDSGFESDASKTNVEEVFKLLSPETEVKVI